VTGICESGECLQIWVVGVVVFFVGNLNKLEEMVLEGEISSVTNSHLGQQHRLH